MNYYLFNCIFGFFIVELLSLVRGEFDKLYVFEA
jgi:hypothetical protein